MIVPSAFITIDPAVGTGATPGVRVTALGTSGVTFSVSLASTLDVVPPRLPTIAVGASSTASISAESTVIVAVAVSQLAGFRTSQIR